MEVSSSTEVQIFDSDGWNRVFPKEAYRLYRGGKATAEQKEYMKKHVLKFLVAYNSEKSVLAYLEKSVKPGSVQISSPGSHGKLTVLHIAAMRGKSGVAEALLEKRADPNAKDAFGWTPLHHAALSSDAVAKLLIEEGADHDALTAVNATCDDLKRLGGRTPCSATLHPLAFEEEGVRTDLTPEELSVRTGFSGYRDDVYYPRAQLQGLWMQGPKEIPPGTVEEALAPVIEAEYLEMQKSPPKLIIGKATHQREGETSYSVFAGERIEKGRMIGEYVGEKITQRSGPFLGHFNGTIEHKPYGFADVDAEHHGNVTRFINDGFPKSVALGVYNSKGRQERLVICAIRDIEEGGELFFDYGGGDPRLKWGRYDLNGREELRSFFGKNPLPRLLRSPAEVIGPLQSKRERDEDLDIHDCLTVHSAELVYAFYTPFALIDLSLSETVSAKEWHAVLKHPQILHARQVHSASQASLQLITILKDLELQFDRIENPAAASQIRRFFLDQMETKDAFQLAKGLDMVEEWLKEVDASKPLEDAWVTKQEELEVFLPGYDWLKDDAWWFTRMLRTQYEETARIYGLG